MSIDTKLGQRLGALPEHSPAQHSRLSLDPRLASKLASLSSVPIETRSALTQYIAAAKWSPYERAVYSAVEEGFTSPEELKTVTGMTTVQVRSTLDKLEKRGVLKRIESV